MIGHDGEAMDRRRFLRATGGVLAASALPLPGLAESGSAPPDHRSAQRDVRAQRWEGYDRAIVIDALGGLEEAPGRAGELSPEVLAELRASGVTAVNVTIGPVGEGPEPFERTVRDLGRWSDRLASHPEHLVHVRTAQAIAAAKSDGRLGVIFGFQDAAMLESRLDRLDLFHDLGVRVIQLTYNRRNALGDGSLEPENRGLTTFGREAVARMNDLAVLVDLSHCGQRTTADAIRASRAPVAVTHSGCAALSALPRNKTDADLRLLADRGGVVGIYFMPFLLERGQPLADDVVRHVEHALQVCGEDHVGVGTDGAIAPVQLDDAYRARIRAEIAERRAAGISAPGETDDIVPLIPDLNHARRMERLADLLAARGHRDGRIEKILGGNFLRLMREVWRG